MCSHLSASECNSHTHTHIPKMVQYMMHKYIDIAKIRKKKHTKYNNITETDTIIRLH